MRNDFKTPGGGSAVEGEIIYKFYSEIQKGDIMGRGKSLK